MVRSKGLSMAAPFTSSRGEGPESRARLSKGLEVMVVALPDLSRSARSPMKDVEKDVVQLVDGSRDRVAAAHEGCAAHAELLDRGA